MAVATVLLNFPRYLSCVGQDTEARRYGCCLLIEELPASSVIKYGSQHCHRKTALGRFVDAGRVARLARGANQAIWAGGAARCRVASCDDPAVAALESFMLERELRWEPSDECRIRGGAYYRVNNFNKGAKGRRSAPSHSYRHPRVYTYNLHQVHTSSALPCRLRRRTPSSPSRSRRPRGRAGA